MLVCLHQLGKTREVVRLSSMSSLLCWYHHVAGHRNLVDERPVFVKEASRRAHLHTPTCTGTT